MYADATPATHSDLYSDPCPLCGMPRPRDLRQPCRGCGSRDHRWVGYVFPHEARAFFLMTSVAIAAVVLALVMAAVYLYYVNFVLAV